MIILAVIIIFLVILIFEYAFHEVYVAHETQSGPEVPNAHVWPGLLNQKPEP